MPATTGGHTVKGFWNTMLRFTIVRSRTVTWMSAGFAALILMTAIAVAGFLYQQHVSDAVRHTVEVDARLGRVLSSLQDAETVQRGFVSSGDDAFLAPYFDSRAAFDRNLHRLRDLVLDNPKQLA